MLLPRDNQQAAFPSTHWTLIHAVQGGSADEAARAMEDLCKRYWYPIYAFLRRSGYTINDSEDLTQAFFHRLLTEKALLTAQQNSGKLRSWLLGVLRHLLSDHARQFSTQKRGGGITHVSFEELAAEDRYVLEPAEVSDPESLFTRAWAEDLVAGVRQKLRLAYLDGGKAEIYDLLLPFLMWNEEPPSCREIAEQIGSSEPATRILIHRLRVKFRSLLRDEIAQTVLAPEEIPAEMTWLQSVLSGK